MFQFSFFPPFLQIMGQFIQELKSFYFLYDFDNKCKDHGGDEFTSIRRHWSLLLPRACLKKLSKKLFLD